jgi:hypothetical protein
MTDRCAAVRAIAVISPDHKSGLVDGNLPAIELRTIQHRDRFGGIHHPFLQSEPLNDHITIHDDDRMKEVEFLKGVSDVALRRWDDRFPTNSFFDMHPLYHRC